MGGTHGEGTGGVPASEGVTARAFARQVVEQSVRILVVQNSKKTNYFQMVESETVPFSYYSKKST